MTEQIKKIVILFLEIIKADIIKILCICHKEIFQ